MKNIFTKKIVLIFLSIFLISIAAFFACKKHDELNNPLKNQNKLMQFYNSSLVESFKKESVAKEFIQEVNKIPVRIVNGILSFNSVEDYNKVYDLIVEYTNKYDKLVEENASYSKYANWEEMPEDIMAFLFESNVGFNSLRMDIEERLITLERGTGISDNNDPDDHYTVSPYQRALLSPDCEVIVDGLICVFYDTYYIGIMNTDWETLRELHQHQRQNNFNELKALEFCSGKANAFFLTTGSEPSLSVDFTYMTDEKNPNIIQFNNYSCSEAWRDMTYLWDFGDGTTSTERNPKHTFSNLRALVDVCLSVSVPGSGGSVSKAQSVACQTIPNPPPPPSSVVNFTYSEGNNGIVFFTCDSPKPPPGGMYRYVWNFGDNSAEVSGYNFYETNHVYSKNGKYNVKLTVYYNSTDFDDNTKMIEVKKQGQAANCCASNDREVEKDGCKYTHTNGEKRRVKQVMRVTNNFLSHRIVAKTKHQYQDNYGSWFARKADVINAGYEGYVYWVRSSCNNCGCPEYIYNSNTPKTNWNQRVLDIGLGIDHEPFTVTKKSLWAKHYVKVGDKVIIDGVGGAAVHDDSCP